jgi:hypothetical protein
MKKIEQYQTRKNKANPPGVSMPMRNRRTSQSQFQKMSLPIGRMKPFFRHGTSTLAWMAIFTDIFYD